MNKTMRPLFLVFLMNIIGFGLLIYRSFEGEGDIPTAAMGTAMLAIILISFALICRFNMGDTYLFLIVSCLLTVGIVMLLRIDKEMGMRQIVWFAVAIIGFFVTYIIYKKFRFTSSLLPLYIGGALLLFLLTFIFGTTVNGSKNWIIIGNTSIQPSEIIKILYVFTLASMFSEPIKELGGDEPFLKKAYHSAHWRQVIIMITAYMHLGFLVLQREWGIGLLFFLIYFTMFYICSREYLLMLANLLCVSGAGILGYRLLYHIQVRVDMWHDPFSDPTGKGFQIVQSLFAIAAGGFTGKGFGQGAPEFIPEVHSDFIFAAICEEMGILGGMGVIMLYFILVYRGFKITLSAKDTFEKLVALGITIMFAFQTFIIIGGVIKFIPLTGITMPFISYGGSSLFTSFIALGILQAISAKKEGLTDAI